MFDSTRRTVTLHWDHVLVLCCDVYSVSPCVLLQVASKTYCNLEIPAEFTGVWRYLQNAYEREEFKQTCPADVEIEKAYLNVANKRN